MSQAAYHQDLFKNFLLFLTLHIKCFAFREYWNLFDMSLIAVFDSSISTQLFVPSSGILSITTIMEAMISLISMLIMRYIQLLCIRRLTRRVF